MTEIPLNDVSKPLYSICIPTFNRAGLLSEAISFSLNQSYKNIEIIISDNASTDKTREVVESFSDARIKYFRNPENIGPIRNFIKLAELANGEFMSWLQDDDLISSLLVERAIESFLLHPDCDLYMPYTMVSKSRKCIFHPDVYGPPLPLDWCNQESKVFPGDIFIPLSLLISTAMPPTAVFRTEALRKKVKCLLDENNFLFGERTLIASVALDASVIVDPRISGIFYSHEAQGSAINYFVEGGIEKKFAYMASTLENLSRESVSYSLENFKELLPEFSIPQLYSFLAESQKWPKDNNLCNSVKEMIYTELLACVSDSERRSVQRFYNPSKFNSIIKQFLPPVVENMYKKLSK